MDLDAGGTLTSAVVSFTAPRYNRMDPGRVRDKVTRHAPRLPFCFVCIRAYRENGGARKMRYRWV